MTNEERAEELAAKLAGCVEQDGPYAEDGWSWNQEEAAALIAEALNASASCQGPERDAVLKEALDAVTAEHLDDPQECDGDEAYDRAIADARQAIGRLFHTQPAAHQGSESPQVTALIADVRLVLQGCDELFGDIRNDWSDPRYECRQGREAAAYGLAKLDELDAALTSPGEATGKA